MTEPSPWQKGQPPCEVLSHSVEVRPPHYVRNRALGELKAKAGRSSAPTQWGDVRRAGNATPGGRQLLPGGICPLLALLPGWDLPPPSGHRSQVIGRAPGIISLQLRVCEPLCTFIRSYFSRVSVATSGNLQLRTAEELSPEKGT